MIRFFSVKNALPQDTFFCWGMPCLLIMTMPSSLLFFWCSWLYYGDMRKQGRCIYFLCLTIALYNFHSRQEKEGNKATASSRLEKKCNHQSHMPMCIFSLFLLNIHFITVFQADIHKWRGELFLRRKTWRCFFIHRKKKIEPRSAWIYLWKNALLFLKATFKVEAEEVKKE